ncbi:MAG TPA: FKBP-type peptidyl-prolyl cis-trans isomerase [Cyclobacteriaceae bacterium]|nr:FKBP-type peptidyl-prolyl cis-trans isomerase [Cyclobacteriaceae bacterium]
MRSKVLIGVMLMSIVACIDTEIPPTFDEQLAADTKAIDDYLAANPPANITDVVIKDASGLRLVISTFGTGTIPPNAGNNLKAAYTGRLLSNGAVFDSNSGYIFKLSDVIQGWKIGIGMLTKGAVAKLYIPSGWAYGATGSGTIPANANLVFDISLLEVTPTQAQLDRLAADGNTIDAYLSENSITAQTHPSGLRYVITQEGGGATPSLYDEVKVKFRATLFDDGLEIYNETYEPSSAFSSRVVNYPHGALVGMQLLPEGGKATFYVPSLLANGMQNVPANGMVIMEIEMLDVINK